VVLDVMLPELSGFEVLRRIRATSRVPVVMLTARGEEVDRVVGLEMGADDYLAKPFSPRELVARVRAVLRRIPGDGQGADGLMVWGPLRLDLRARRALVGDSDLELTSAELRILDLLVRADTRTVTREELMTLALGRRLLPTDRSLDTHVSNLRRKLQKHTDRVNVQSVRGSGYALALAFARAAGAPEARTKPHAFSLLAHLSGVLGSAGTDSRGYRDGGGQCHRASHGTSLGAARAAVRASRAGL
jgi:DNA-binding response OmpR family regulator